MPYMKFKKYIFSSKSFIKWFYQVKEDLQLIHRSKVVWKQTNI